MYCSLKFSVRLCSVFGTGSVCAWCRTTEHTIYYTDRQSQLHFQNNHFTFVNLIYHKTTAEILYIPAEAIKLSSFRKWIKNNARDKKKTHQTKWRKKSNKNANEILWCINKSIRTNLKCVNH